MSKKHLITAAAGDPRDVVALLQARLGMKPARAQQAVREGAVWVDGKRASPSLCSVIAGQRVTVFVDEEAPPAAAPQVIYEDRELLIVDKPAGLLCQPGRRGGPSLLTILPGPLWLPHRLDGDTSGLTLLARSAEVCARLSQSLVAGQVERRYLARVRGLPAPKGRIGLRIGKSAGPGVQKMRAYPATASEGDAAQSDFLRLDIFDGVNGPESLLLVRLETGRTHQVRVHLAASGHPIVGDKLYGGPPWLRLGLHATRLVLPHPRTGHELTLTAEPPPEFWPRAAPDLATVR